MTWKTGQPLPTLSTENKLLLLALYLITMPCVSVAAKRISITNYNALLFRSLEGCHACWSASQRAFITRAIRCGFGGPLS